MGAERRLLSVGFLRLGFWEMGKVGWIFFVEFHFPCDYHFFLDVYVF